MARNRREFLQMLGIGVAAATCASPVAAWAQRIRVLEGAENPEQTPRPPVSLILSFNGLLPASAWAKLRATRASVCSGFMGARPAHPCRSPRLKRRDPGGIS